MKVGIASHWNWLRMVVVLEIRVVITYSGIRRGQML